MPDDFQSFRFEAEAAGVSFHSTMAELPRADGPGNVALISARTADCPALTKQAVDAGYSTIYLEKPGAATLEELQDLAAHAKANGAEVFMGYNKNVAKYAADAISFAADLPEPPVIYFSHNNTFTQDELPQCFETNNEGILKNMAVHELCM